jgi:hypothetical protein
MHIMRQCVVASSVFLCAVTMEMDGEQAQHLYVRTPPAFSLSLSNCISFKGVPLAAADYQAEMNVAQK